jgi:hypothetical protein
VVNNQGWVNIPLSPRAATYVFRRTAARDGLKLSPAGDKDFLATKGTKAQNKPFVRFVTFVATIRRTFQRRVRNVYIKASRL